MVLSANVCVYAFARWCVHHVSHGVHIICWVHFQHQVSAQFGRTTFETDKPNFWERRYTHRWAGSVTHTDNAHCWYCACTLLHKIIIVHHHSLSQYTCIVDPQTDRVKQTTHIHLYLQVVMFYCCTVPLFELPPYSPLISAFRCFWWTSVLSIST